jgi:hypothetical protein
MKEIQVPGTETVQTEKLLYPLWWVVEPMLKTVDVTAALLTTHSVTCDLRLEATLRNVSKLDFTLATDDVAFTLPVSTPSAAVPASTTCASEKLGQVENEVVSELLYQLRWPMGKEEPDTREQILAIVAHRSPRAKVRYG